MKKLNELFISIKNTITKNFISATLNFLFIIIFINVFQKLFGAENSIVGVIFAIMMSASMVRDLTATPVRHFIIQSITLVLMSAAACIVATVSPWWAFFFNVIMLFLILYAFTYEYANQLYFPYILSYLFLIFISPVSPEHLPKRMLAMVTGAVCIIAYQWIHGRKRIVVTSQDVLGAMCLKVKTCIQQRLDGIEETYDPESLREDLCELSQLIYDRRKKALCISDASFAMINVGRGLEDLAHLICTLDEDTMRLYLPLFEKILIQIEEFHDFIVHEKKNISFFAETDFQGIEDASLNSIYQSLSYIYKHLLQMSIPDHRHHYRKTMLSLSIRFKAALNVSSVRVIYALRVSVLLAAATFIVQMLQLPHGKWLLFTLASVSLPYADDIKMKAKKRLIATLIGGVVGALLYSFLPSLTMRTFIMMLSGYVSYYFTDYSATFACSTIGALGGAVFMNAFGWEAVGQIFGIRLGYVLLGILIGWIANCLFFPYKRKQATKQLWKKYIHTTQLLTQICHKENTDHQLYYNLVIQAHLLENKLLENAKALNWDGAKDLMAKCREAVRLAHRQPLSS